MTSQMSITAPGSVHGGHWGELDLTLKRDPSPCCSLIKPRSEVRGLRRWADLVPSRQIRQRKRVGVKG